MSVPSHTLVSCPACPTQLRVAADQVGKRVRCPKCKTIFAPAAGPAATVPVAAVVTLPSQTAEPPPPATPPPPEPPPAPAPATPAPAESDRSYFEWLAKADDPLAKPAPPPPPKPEPPPVPRAAAPIAPPRPSRTDSPRPADDEAGNAPRQPAPRSGKRPADKPRPDRRRAGAGEREERRSGGGLLLVVIAGLGLFFLASVAGAAYVAYSYLLDEDTTETTDTGAPPTQPDPVPTPGSNSAASKVKAATVVVKAFPADGQAATSASGFFAASPGGLIVTSARAVGQGRQLVRMSRVEAVVAGPSGAPVTHTVQVIGADPDLDLALLRVGVPELPGPLDFADSFLVKDGTPVVVYAAPADGAQGVTATNTTVTGQRSVAGTRPWFVLAAGLPAAAGGPVTDAAGRLIGAVGTIPGANASAIVPSETVRGFVQSALRSYEENGPLAVAPPGHPDDNPRPRPPRRDDPPPPPPNPFNPPDFPRPPVVPPGFDPPVLRPPAFPPPGFPPDFDPRRPGAQPPGPPKPKIAFPAVAAVEIKAAPLTRDRIELKLPDRVTDTCVGGGGRYWCLLLADSKQVGVFDTAAAKVVKYLPVGANVKITAGMTKLVVADPDAGQFTRYDLKTFEKEQSAKFPFDGTLRALTMGSSSGGPLVVSYMRPRGGAFGAAVAVVDVSTFKELDPGPTNGTAPLGFHREPMQYRAAPDGRVVTAHGGGEHFWHVYTLSEVGVAARPVHEPGVIVSPAEDGTLLASNALYAPDLRPLGPKDRSPSLRVPAPHGSMFLTVTPDREPGAFPNPNQPAGRLKYAVHVLGSDRPLLVLPDPGVTLPLTFAWNAVPGLPADRRVLFCPAANLIGFVSGDDTLVLLRFDLDAELTKAGADYLYVTTRPPAAVRGQVFKYALGVKSNKGGVKVRLDAAPFGMKVDGTTVTWDVPRGGPPAERVVLKLTDAAGQEVTHTFSITVKGD